MKADFQMNSQNDLTDRNSLSYKVSKALRQPGRVWPYFQRLWRNRRLRRESADYLDFYRKVVDHNVTAENADKAVGSADHEAWLEMGKVEFDFLVQHGLLPGHSLLDIGCGNLRAGLLIMEYLDAGHYVGLDISAKVLQSGLRLIGEHHLQSKRPYLYNVSDCDYNFLPADHFAVAHAHGVFSQLPLDIIRECLTQVRRVLKPGGYFDFTYTPSAKEAYTFCGEDFYYPDAQMLNVARQAGFDPQPMEDWVYFQKKIRAIKR